MPSFDIESTLDPHEVVNAVDQANREITNRYDFKNSGACFELNEFVVTMTAPSDFQLQQMQDILRLKLSKRGIDVGCLDVAEPELSLHQARQVVTLRQGIDTALGKKLIKQIKEKKLKVQASIQGDKLRVSGKKRDDLQLVIALVKSLDIELPLQFENFRD